MGRYGEYTRSGLHTVQSVMPVINADADLIIPSNVPLQPSSPSRLSFTPTSSPRLPDYIDLNIGDWVLFHPFRNAPSIRWLKTNFLTNTIDWRQTTTSSNRISILLHHSSSSPISTLIRVEAASSSSSTFP